jgi:hypothetical protein
VGRPRLRLLEDAENDLREMEAKAKHNGLPSVVLEAKALGGPCSRGGSTKSAICLSDDTFHLLARRTELGATCNRI